MRDRGENVWVCRCGQANVSEKSQCVYCGKTGFMKMKRLGPQPYTPEWHADQRERRSRAASRRKPGM